VTELATIPPGDTPARPARGLLNTLIGRAVRDRLASGWFLARLEAAVQSDSARELIERAAATAVNAALAARLRRPSFRAELRELIRDVLAEQERRAR
jgi:hypothetical protein